MNDKFDNREQNEETGGYDPEKDGYYPDSVSDADSYEAKKRSDAQEPYEFHKGKTDRGNFIAIIGAALGIASVIGAALGALLMLFLPLGGVLLRASITVAIAGFIVSCLGVSYSRRKNGEGLAVGLGGSVLSALAFFVCCVFLFFGSCIGCAVM